MLQVGARVRYCHRGITREGVVRGFVRPCFITVAWDDGSTSNVPPMLVAECTEWDFPLDALNDRSLTFIGSIGELAGLSPAEKGRLLDHVVESQTDQQGQGQGTAHTLHRLDELRDALLRDSPELAELQGLADRPPNSGAVPFQSTNLRDWRGLLPDAEPDAEQVTSSPRGLNQVASAASEEVTPPSPPLDARAVYYGGERQD